MVFCCGGLHLLILEEIILVSCNQDLHITCRCAHRKQPIASGATVTFTCSDLLKGRYVYVVFAGNEREFLSLCEVEVFAVNPKSPLSLVNLAEGRPTIQSSTKYDGVSSRAVDGNLSPLWNRHSCTYTQVQKNPWFEVQLAKEYIIGRVRLTNRGDCCGDRLANIEIRVGNVDRNPDANKLCVKQAKQVEQAQSQDFYCTHPIAGKYVYLLLRKTDVLTICEIEVFIANLALHKKTKQSSVKYGGVASRLVDGNTNNNYKAGSCMQTQGQSKPWVMIDLGKQYTVNEVAIYARGDCCGFTLNNFDIRVGNTDGNPGANPLCIHYPGSSYNGQVYNLICQHSRNGRYVFLWLKYPDNYQYITICEMKVYSGLLIS